MRTLLAIAALLLAAPAQAQVVGWAQCRHDLVGEKLLWVSVELMDGNTPRRGTTRHREKLVVGQNRIEFNAITGPAQFTGMRIGCEIQQLPGSGITTEQGSWRVNWEKVLTVAEGVTTKPALSLMLHEYAPGLWRAYIGRAP